MGTLTEHHPPALHWVPNALTAVRIALVPVWLMVAAVERARALEGLEVRRLAVLGLVALIGATDFFDGLIARRYGLATHAGAVADAFADKLATFSAVTFLAFAGPPAFTALPLWLWGVLVARDLALGTGYLVLRAKGLHVDASHEWYGRASTALLFLVVVLAIARAPEPVVTGLAVALALLVVPGTLGYLRRGLAQLAAAR